MSTALSTPTLVLNKVWFPINIVPGSKGICMLFEGTAEAICTDTYMAHTFESWVDFSATLEEGRFVTSPSVRIKVPDVLVLKDYDRVPKMRAKLSRHNIYRRDAYTCQYCGEEFRRADLTIDHVLPRSKGGITSWTNCVAACLPCNASKADRTLDKCGHRLLRAPFEPDGRHMASMLAGHARPEWDKFIRS